MVDTCLEEVNETALDKFVHWGSSGSEAMLDFPCFYFQITECKGFIAYRLESKTAVVFGDPICPKAELPILTEAFHRYCQQNSLDIIYIIVSEGFAKWLTPKYCKVALEVCEELIFDPSTFERSKRLNYRLNQALKLGLSVHEYTDSNSTIEAAILEVGRCWRKARKGPQLHLGHLNFFEHRTGKRWFYVEDKDEIIAMAMICKIESRKGWLLKYLMAKPTASSFTSELLMCKIMDILGQEGYSFLSYGMVPAKSLGKINGLNNFSAWFVRSAFKLVKKLFKLDQKKSYWLRYHPKTEPAYVLFSNSHIGISSIQALIKALKTD